MFCVCVLLNDCNVQYARWYKEDVDMLSVKHGDESVLCLASNAELVCFRQHIQLQIISCQILLAFKSAMQSKRTVGVKCHPRSTQAHTGTHTNTFLLSPQIWDNEILMLHRLQLSSRSKSETETHERRTPRFLCNVWQLSRTAGLLEFTRSWGGGSDTVTLWPFCVTDSCLVSFAPNVEKYTKWI